MKGILIFIAVVVLLAIFGFIGSQNSQLINVNFIIAQAEIRLSTLMAIVLLIGAIIGLLMMMTSWLALRVKLALANQKLKRIQSE